MSKVFYFISLILLMCGVVFFYSCAKDRGKLPPKPFNLNVVEGFESSANFPAGWTWVNPDNDAKWVVNTTVGHNSKNSMAFNNCSGNGTASMTKKKDRCITAAYDFTEATSANISFDVAYAVLFFKNITYTDSLAVFASTDGGNSWNQIYLKGGENLSNIPIITTATPCWEPASSNEWRTDKITVNSLAGKSKVMFAFENRSDWGEWIYIDNVTITATNTSNTNCDKVTYTKDVKPIMITKCATPNCHVPGGSNPTDLDTYAGVKAIVDNGRFKKRMIDGNPSFMPTSGKLSGSVLGNIQCWLDNGAPNN
jgi:hypothetical protein